MSFLLVGALMWLSAGSAQQSTAAKPLVRPCADSWSDSGSQDKKHRSKSSARKAHQETGACIELAFSALEIQEYLQLYARTQQWKISESGLTEDSWTFSLELDKDELLSDTTEDSNHKRVEWTGGTVRVHVNTVQLPDGYSRTIVRGSFRGYGRGMDQFAMQKEYWELDSNNNLENSIVSVVRTHFAAISSAETRHTKFSSGISWAKSWRKVLERADFKCLQGEKVEDVKKGDDGIFFVTSSKGQHRARHVVLALGKGGSPRKLGVNGEHLPKVMYRLIGVGFGAQDLTSSASKEAKEARQAVPVLV